MPLKYREGDYSAKRKLGEMTVEVTFRGTTGIGTVTATVDTGATNTTIGRRLAERIGIVAVDSQEVVLANGKSDIVGVGSADIEI